MKSPALPWLVALIVIASAAWAIVREQRATNQQILSALNQVKAALDAESNRSHALEQQVGALSDRVVSLEQEVIELRRRVTTLSRRANVARSETVTIDAVALAPLAPFSPSPRTEDPGPLVIDVLPITWATDWTAYQPAGIIAPPARVVIQRRLSDPAFLKKLYVGYAALQIGDIISTTTAIRRGAREGNPLISNIAHSPTALVGLKAAGGVGMVIAIEKLRQKHPVAASVTLIAINATLAAVTINNVTVGAPKNRAIP